MATMEPVPFDEPDVDLFSASASSSSRNGSAGPSFMRTASASSTSTTSSGISIDVASASMSPALSTSSTLSLNSISSRSSAATATTSASSIASTSTLEAEHDNDKIIHTSSHTTTATATATPLLVIIASSETEHEQEEQQAHIPNSVGALKPCSSSTTSTGESARSRSAGSSTSTRRSRHSSSSGSSSAAPGASYADYIAAHFKASTPALDQRHHQHQNPRTTTTTATPSTRLSYRHANSSSEHDYTHTHSNGSSKRSTAPRLTRSNTISVLPSPQRQGQEQHQQQHHLSIPDAPFQHQHHHRTSQSGRSHSSMGLSSLPELADLDGASSSSSSGVEEKRGRTGSTSGTMNPHSPPPNSASTATSSTSSSRHPFVDLLADEDGLVRAALPTSGYHLVHQQFQQAAVLPHVTQSSQPSLPAGTLYAHTGLAWPTSPSEQVVSSSDARTDVDSQFPSLIDRAQPTLSPEFNRGTHDHLTAGPPSRRHSVDHTIYTRFPYSPNAHSHTSHSQSHFFDRPSQHHHHQHHQHHQSLSPQQLHPPATSNNHNNNNISRYRKASLGSNAAFQSNAHLSSGVIGLFPSMTPSSSSPSTMPPSSSSSTLPSLVPSPSISTSAAMMSLAELAAASAPVKPAQPTRSNSLRWFDSAPLMQPSLSNTSSSSTSSSGNTNLTITSGQINTNLSNVNAASPSNLVGYQQQSNIISARDAYRSPTRSRRDSLMSPPPPTSSSSASASLGLTRQISHPSPPHAVSSAHSTTRYIDERGEPPQRNNQLEAKIVLLGRQGVGKTSLVHRYMTGQFSSSLPTTIGASFMVKKLVMDNVKVRMQIWDTAGQERFRSMAPMYYRGAHAAILVYDLTAPDSLDDIKVWLDELRRNMTSELIIHIVGCKADLAPAHRRVDLEDAKYKIAGWINNDSSSADSENTQQVSSHQQHQQKEPTTSAATAALKNSFASSFGLSRVAHSSSTSTSTKGRSLHPDSAAKNNNRTTTEGGIAQSEPVWNDISISEVSSKHDQGIEDLFLAIASKLVERKVQIEHDRILRTKDSVMLGERSREEQRIADTKSWGCC